MSSKKKNKNKTGKQPGKNKKDPKNIIIIALLVLVVAAIVALGFQMKTSSKETSATSTAVDEQSLRKGENRETLSPVIFSDPFIAGMYQAARDIPHVFDSVKCYCYCDRDPFYHKSLLSCFVDKHAAG